MTTHIRFDFEKNENNTIDDMTDLIANIREQAVLHDESLITTRADALQRDIESFFNLIDANLQ